MLTRCPFCHREYDIQEEAVGWTVECHFCRREFEVQEINSNTSTEKEVSYKTTAMTMLVVCALLIGITFGICKYSEHKAKLRRMQAVENNKKIITEIMLDQAKYPGSSDVVIEQYMDYDEHLGIDGYIDMANAYGVKIRYEFRFVLSKVDDEFIVVDGMKIIVAKNRIKRFLFEKKGEDDLQVILIKEDEYGDIQYFDTKEELEYLKKYNPSIIRNVKNGPKETLRLFERVDMFSR